MTIEHAGDDCDHRMIYYIIFDDAQQSQRKKKTLLDLEFLNDPQCRSCEILADIHIMFKIQFYRLEQFSVRIFHGCKSEAIYWQ